MEVALVKAYHWSLRDIDDTSIESLLPFVGRVMASGGGGGKANPKQTYCDEVSWL